MSETDRPEVDAWIAADPGHAGKMTADFFLTPGRFHSLYAVCDEDGTCMYIRQEAFGSKTRAHIQFGTDRKRIMNTFREGFPQIVSDAKSRGFTGISFDSASPALIKWMVSEFHFRAELELAL